MSDSVLALIDQAAWRYGVSAALLHRIAKCESGYDPHADNWPCGCHGLFQFQWNTWNWAAPRAGWAGYSLYHAEASANVAAWAIRQGYRSWWPNC